MLPLGKTTYAEQVDKPKKLLILRLMKEETMIHLHTFDFLFPDDQIKKQTLW